MSRTFRAAAFVLVLSFGACADTLDLTRPPTRVEAACTLGHLFDALPRCPDSPGDGRVDLASGCVDDGCVDMTALQLEAVWGVAPTCGRPSAQGTLACAWPDGISARFVDADRDGVPDPQSPVGTLSLEAPYAGTTPEGLGPDAPLSCFLRELGDPDVVSAVDDDGYTFRYLAWTADGVAVYDPRGEGVASIVALGGAR